MKRTALLFALLISPLFGGVKEDFETLTKQRDEAAQRALEPINKAFAVKAEKLVASAIQAGDLDTAAKIKEVILSSKKAQPFDSFLFENVWNWRIENSPHLSINGARFLPNGKMTGHDWFRSWEKIDSRTIKVNFSSESAIFEFSNMDKKLKLRAGETLSPRHFEVAGKQ